MAEENYEAGTFVPCTFEMQKWDSIAAIEIDVNTNDAEQPHVPSQAIYGDEIEALGQWFLKCARKQKRILKKRKLK